MRRIVLFLLSASASVAIDCQVGRDEGDFCDGHGPTRMFYFDSRTKVCQPFQYRGCGGNQNRFATSAECRAECQGTSRTSPSTSSSIQDPNSPPFQPRGTSHDQWRKADICGGNFLIPNGRYVTCTNSACPQHHTCTNGACCPDRDYVCSLRDENGNFEDGIEDRPRFGWSHQVGSCVRYSYYGANGNYNNFPNFQSCMRYCKGAARIN